MRGRFVYSTCCILLVLAAASLPVPLAAGDNQLVIKEGETLFSVARRARVPVDVLGAYNGITDTDRVKVGTVLHVPAVHVVRKGDTLYGIARGFGMPLSRILELNKLSADALLKVGTRLFIPLDADRGSGPVGTQAAAGTPAATGSSSAGTQAAAGDPAVSPVGTGSASAAAFTARPGAPVVWPHPGRHERDNGKIPGLVFYGSPGDVVRSATAGEVKWAATYWTRGKVVIIKAPDGNLFTYGGNAELLVNVGDRVSAGMDIAKLGESPQGGGARLYFSISDGTGRAVNPERFFSGKSDS